ncbi:MAG: phosphoribosyltransferase [Acidobacteriota bacterium]
MVQRIFENRNLRNRTQVFRDRSAGGRVLASLLQKQNELSGKVLAIPAGGIPVALELCESLKLPLNLMIVSKITFSWNSEAGYGALAYDGTYRLNDNVIRMLRMTPDEIQNGMEQTKKQVTDRLARLRKWHESSEIEGETVLLVDDGLASGITMHVAVEVARNHNAKRVLVAIPTGHETSVKELASAADAVYCANIRDGSSFAVADAYREWYDLSDEMVDRLLSSNSCKQRR